MTDVALSPPGMDARRPLWRLAAIILFLGLPLGCAAVVLNAATAALDASQRADQAEDIAYSIVHRLDRRPAEADTTGLYLGSSNASLARAELQALVVRLVDATGGRLVEVRPSDRDDPDAPGRVSLDVTLATSNAGLLDLLYGIETGLPLLTVPRLDVRAESGEGAAPQGGTLQVTLAVEAQWRAAQ